MNQVRLEATEQDVEDKPNGKKAELSSPAEVQDLNKPAVKNLIRTRVQKVMSEDMKANGTRANQEA